jgi:hypothetical protein
MCDKAVEIWAGLAAAKELVTFSRYLGSKLTIHRH